MSEREWWEPVVTDEEWLAEKRADYPDECAGLDDDDVREKYADGLKYQTLWDNLGDARDEHEALADAYLALRAEVAALREALRHAARELQHVLDADPCEQREIHQSGEALACVVLAESLLGPMRDWPEEPNASARAAEGEGKGGESERNL